MRPFAATNMTARNRTAKVFRAAAVTLLLFTVVDLAFDDLWCGEERFSFATSSQWSAHSKDSRPQPAQNDDCFCCCGHVTFTHVYAFHAATLMMATPRVELQRLLPAAAQPTPPPPRSA